MARVILWFLVSSYLCLIGHMIAEAAREGASMRKEAHSSGIGRESKLMRNEKHSTEIGRESASMRNKARSSEIGRESKLMRNEAHSSEIGKSIRHVTGFKGELTEAQNPAFDGEANEFALVRLHEEYSRKTLT